MNITGQEFIFGCSAIGCGICMIAGLGPGIGQGIAAGFGALAVGRNPGARGDVTSTMILGQAVAETTGLYSLAYDICTFLHIPFSYDFIQSTGAFILANAVIMIINFLFYDRLVFDKKVTA